MADYVGKFMSEQDKADFEAFRLVKDNPTRKVDLDRVMFHSEGGRLTSIGTALAIIVLHFLALACAVVGITMAVSGEALPIAVSGVGYAAMFIGSGLSIRENLK